jgi:hypothetical protein
VEEVREYDENETDIASIRIYAALFLLHEDDYEKSRLAVTGEFIEVSHSCRWGMFRALFFLCLICFPPPIDRDFAFCQIMPNFTITTPTSCATLQTSISPSIIIDVL